MRLIICILCFSCLNLKFAFTQVKYEKEYRINKSKIPENMKSYLNTITFKNKIKWYKDEALNKYTYEAKTSHNNLNFSIEFDSLGIIEDVEFEIQWKNIPELAKKNIDIYLDSIYQKKKIIKVQIQYTGKPENLIDVIKDVELKNRLTRKYEIVLKGKENKKFQMMEYLFSNEGKFEDKAIIIMKNTDNLEY
tara:strand:+ start:7537 stop:8112 length:576 start_codon:yes stop_codon:yes gene_type:complete